MPEATGTATTGIVGVVGAGTMGAGIAEAAARGGCTVRLHDPFPEALARGMGTIERNLARSVKRNKLDESEAKVVLSRLEPVDAIDGLSGCSVVIEAVFEDRAVKDDVFRRLDSACSTPAVLATNTSSLSVTSIAAAVTDPGRVVGMHFFNPAPVMRLVEVVAGARSRPEALEAAEALATAMGKTPVRVADTPGFIVNRVARPFYGEGLRLLGEGVAGVDEIDAAVRAVGFRMGPFELMDLIGIEVNLAVTKTVWEATFHEPRYRPHTIQARLAEAGMHGRKTGQGFYRYDESGAPLGPSEGIAPSEGIVPGGGTPALPLGAEEVAAVADILSLPSVEGTAIEGAGTQSAGIAARLLAALVNEAIFAADDGVATPAGIDDAMRLGANHPRGPFEWLSTLGPGLVLAVMDGLWSWYREERYRPAPGLRRRAQGR